MVDWWKELAPSLLFISCFNANSKQNSIVVADCTVATYLVASQHVDYVTCASRRNYKATPMPSTLALENPNGASVLHQSVQPHLLAPMSEKNAVLLYKIALDTSRSESGSKNQLYERSPLAISGADEQMCATLCRVCSFFFQINQSISNQFFD
jgi:hypothetical protein